jgi:hypothetical protein
MSGHIDLSWATRRWLRLGAGSLAIAGAVGAIVAEGTQGIGQTAAPARASTASDARSTRPSLRIAQASPATSAAQNTQTTPAPSNASAIRYVDPNVQANAATSGAFADRVFVAFWRRYHAGSAGYVTIPVYSPTTGHTYQESCNSDSTTVMCSHGTDYVTFPMRAVEAYSPGHDAKSAHPTLVNSGPVSCGPAGAMHPCRQRPSTK